MNAHLFEVLKGFDSRDGAFTEYAIADALDAVTRLVKENATPLSHELLAERIAFNLSPDEGKNTKWGTYFGPIMGFQKNDGTIIDSPSLDSITEDVIAHWEQRATEAQHPIMRCRYADLVWDFKSKMTNARPAVQFARQIVDETLSIVSRHLMEDSSEAEIRLGRALSIALAINDKDRITKIRDSIIDLPNLFDDFEDKRLASLYAFDQLVGNRKVELDPATEQSLVSAVENLLAISSGGTDKKGSRDHWGGEEIAIRLADYYRKCNLTDDVRRVLKLYGDTAIATSVDALAMVATAWLRRVYDVYLDYGMSTEAEAVLKLIERRSKGINDELVRISHSVEIPEEKLNAVMDDLTNGPLPAVLGNLAINFLPSVSETERLVREIAKDTFFMNVFTQEVLDSDGRIVASVKPVHEDLDGQVVLQMCQMMQAQGSLLRMAIERAMSRLNLSMDSMVQWFMQSRLFVDRIGFLAPAITAYLQQDWLTSIHLALPQTEHALRQIIKLCGGTTFRRHRGGGMVLKNLDDVLRDPQMAKAISDDIRVYLRVLLCDLRGWNIRNNVAHGLWEFEQFNSMVADRVFHALLVLGSLKPAVSETPEDRTVPGESDRIPPSGDE